MFSNLNTTQKGLILIAVPIFFEIVFVLILGLGLNNVSKDLDGLEHENDALRTLHQYEFAISDAADWLLLHHTRDDAKQLKNIDFLKHWLMTDGQASVNTIGSYPELRAISLNMREVCFSVYDCLDKMEKVILDPSIAWGQRVQHYPKAKLLQMAMRASDFSREIVQIETKQGRRGPSEIEATRHYLLLTVIIGVLINALLSLVIAQIFGSNMRRRLSGIVENATRVARGETLPVPIPERDEIAAAQRVLYQSSLVLEDMHRKENAVVNNAADVICSLDENLRFHAVSQASSKMWGHSEDELLGRSVLTMLHRDSVNPARAAFTKATHNSAGSNLECTMLCSTGRHMVAAWRIKWSPEDRIYYCVAHDVTELRAVEKLKQQFLAIVSHDLRAPLTSVNLSLTMLLEGKRGSLSEAAVRQLDRSQRSLNRLVSLVNELLELEKFGSGRMQIEKRDMSAADACRAAIESVEGMARMARVTLVAPKTDAPLLADESRVIQAIVNLLSNAIKFSRPGANIEIDISAEEGFVLFSITDEGPGIAPEQQTLIFEKFHQTEAQSHVAVKGTGLGLAIVKAIAEAHEGTVGLRSEPGKGSTFWFRIPALIDQCDEVSL